MHKYDKIMGGAGIGIFLVCVIMTVALGGTVTAGDGTPDDKGDEIDWTKYELKSNQITKSDYANENTDYDIEITIPEENIKSVTATLNWKDEPDERRIIRTLQNRPDSFGLDVAGPSNQSASASPATNTRDANGGTGSVTCVVDLDPDTDPYLNGTGKWVFTVKCGNCDDKFPRIGIIGENDPGNDWDLVIDYEYYVKKTSEGE